MLQGSERISGPEFTLDERTTLTEVGAFVESCAFIDFGCPVGTPPFAVEIRRSVDGIPDTATALGRFVLSDDGDPTIVSYESTEPDLTLAPGSYFALFGPQSETVAGGLVCCPPPWDVPPTIPVGGLVTLGFLAFPDSAWAWTDYVAARILGRGAEPLALVRDLLAMVDQENLGPGTSLHDKLVETQALLQAGDSAGACTKLVAFDHSVRAQTGKRVAAAAAEELLSRAAEVRQAIGC